MVYARSASCSRPERLAAQALCASTFGRVPLRRAERMLVHTKRFDGVGASRPTKTPTAHRLVRGQGTSSYLRLPGARGQI